MKTLTVLIPTRNRIDKLKKCLDSIPKKDYIRVAVVCDGDHATYDYMLSNYSHDVLLLHTHVGAVAARNSAMCLVEDGLLYATDDIVFMPDCIENAFKTFNETFPDDDGVVGIPQDKDHHPAGVALVGSKFINRYPERKVFFPGYFHFACQEIFWLAKPMEKFVISRDSLIKHYHPAFYKEMHDTTHDDARVHRAKDLQLLADRQKRGLIWGS